MVDFVDEYGARLTVRANRVRDDCLVFYTNRAVGLKESDIRDLMNLLKLFLEGRAFRSRVSERRSSRSRSPRFPTPRLGNE